MLDIYIIFGEYTKGRRKIFVWKKIFFKVSFEAYRGQVGNEIFE